MSLFSCCPKKPKKSLDYVIKWIEDTDKTIKELTIWKDTINENISELVTEAIEDYDWSNLPVEALSKKADKVENATPGHLAALDSNGNLVDSGADIDAVIEEGNTDLVPSGTIYNALQGKVDKVASAINGHFASLDVNGNLVDSGKKPADFAYADHSHNIIRYGKSGEAGAQVGTQATTSDGGKAYVSVSKWIDGVLKLKQVFIQYDNADNLNRAISDPVKSTDASTTYDDSKLITSGAVKASIDEVSLSLSGKENIIPLIGLIQAVDEPNWEPDVSYDSIYTAACSWGKTRPVLVRFLKIDTFDVTLIGTLSANFNSADGTATAVICAGGYKFVRREHLPASSIEELIWNNTGVTKTAISI